MRLRRLALALLGLGSTLFPVQGTVFAQATSPPANVNLTDLGTLGGTNSRAVAVNANGLVVGNSTTATGDQHAFIWSPYGGMIDLGTLGGSSSTATALSANGHVVGYSNTGAGDQHAFLWTSGRGMTDLGTLSGSWSRALAVNARGQVVGMAQVREEGYDDYRAFSWTEEGGMIDLGGLYRELPSVVSGGEALAVNANGVVVGDTKCDTFPTAFSWTAQGGMVGLGGWWVYSSAVAVNDSGHAVGYNGGHHMARAYLWTETGPISLGTWGYATEINADDQVVGAALLSPSAVENSRAFSWTRDGGMIYLGTLGGASSRASALNISGQVVGASNITTTGTVPPCEFGWGRMCDPEWWAINGPLHAFSWTQQGGMVDLGTLGGSVSDAVALNDSGWIVGTSTTAVGDTHAALWRPVLYTLGGFYKPVEIGEVWNTVKGGATVPLKFEVFAGSTEITDPLVVQQPLTATQTACDSGPLDAVELTATGGTTLRYDTTAGQFVYNWQTPRTPGACYLVTVTLTDGSSMTAKFKLR